MHGQFCWDLERTSVDREKSLVWVCSWGLKGEMERLIIAAQDQAPSTCYHQKNIMKRPVDSTCRISYKAEHIKHIVAGCITLVPSEYTKRHYKVGGYIHCTIYKHMGLQVTDKCYRCIPERVINANSTTIMWDVLVITDWKILANRPDIVLCDKKRRPAYWLI